MIRRIVRLIQLGLTFRAGGADPFHERLDGFDDKGAHQHGGDADSQIDADRPPFRLSAAISGRAIGIGGASDLTEEVAGRRRLFLRAPDLAEELVPRGRILGGRDIVHVKADRTILVVAILHAPRHGIVAVGELVDHLAAIGHGSCGTGAGHDQSVVARHLAVGLLQIGLICVVPGLDRVALDDRPIRPGPAAGDGADLAEYIGCRRLVLTAGPIQAEELRSHIGARGQRLAVIIGEHLKVQLGGRGVAVGRVPAEHAFCIGKLVDRRRIDAEHPFLDQDCRAGGTVEKGAVVGVIEIQRLVLQIGKGLVDRCGSRIVSLLLQPGGDIGFAIDVVLVCLEHLGILLGDRRIADLVLHKLRCEVLGAQFHHHSQVARMTADQRGALVRTQARPVHHESGGGTSESVQHSRFQRQVVQRFIHSPRGAGLLVVLRGLVLVQVGNRLHLTPSIRLAWHERAGIRHARQLQTEFLGRRLAA